MIWIVDPPFVDGNNLKYLSDNLKSFLLESKLKFTTNVQIVFPRKGSGFYNNENWIEHTRKSVDFVMDEMKDGDTVIFVDFWNPSIQHVWLQARLRNISIKIIGWFHGSTFLEHDYLAKSNFFKNENSEKINDAVIYAQYSWFEMCDQIWCASRYFSSGIPYRFKSKILYVPEPFDSEEYSKFKVDAKLWDVVYPFRLDVDKVDLKVLFYVINNLKTKTFLITSPSTIPLDMKNILDKIDNVVYYENCTNETHLTTMAKSRIIFSTAFQEGWGYSVLKGVSVGCIPLLPNRAVYTELYDDRFLYNGSEEDALTKLKRILYSYKTFDFPKLPIKFNFKKFVFSGGLLKLIGDYNEGSNARRII